MRREIIHANNINSLKLRLPKYLYPGVLALIFFSFCCFWLHFHYPIGEWHVTKAFHDSIFMSLGFGILLVWLFRTYNAYTPGYFRIQALAFSQFLRRF